MTRLLDKIAVLIAVCHADGETEFKLCPFVFLRGKGYCAKEEVHGHLPALVTSLPNPVLLVVTGYGVLDKARTDQTGIVERVLADRINFFCRERNDTLLFIRSVQLGNITALLEKNKIDCCDIELLKEITPSALENYVETFVRTHVKLSVIFRPGKRNSILSETLYKKARFYLLGVILFLLVANLFFNAKFEEIASRQTVQLLALEKQNGKQTLVSKEKQKILTEFAEQLSWKYSVLCDYIAAQVPPEITLERISVQPLRKQLMNGMPPLVNNNRILVGGHAGDVTEITRFISRLEKEPYACGVHLRQMHQDKESGVFLFNLEIML